MLGWLMSPQNGGAGGDGPSAAPARPGGAAACLPPAPGDIFQHVLNLRLANTLIKKSMECLAYLKLNIGIVVVFVERNLLGAGSCRDFGARSHYLLVPRLPRLPPLHA